MLQTVYLQDYNHLSNIVKVLLVPQKHIEAWIGDLWPTVLDLCEQWVAFLGWTCSMTSCRWLIGLAFVKHFGLFVLFVFLEPFSAVLWWGLFVLLKEAAAIRRRVLGFKWLVHVRHSNAYYCRTWGLSAAHYQKKSVIPSICPLFSAVQRCGGLVPVRMATRQRWGTAWTGHLMENGKIML